MRLDPCGQAGGPIIWDTPPTPENFRKTVNQGAWRSMGGLVLQISPPPAPIPRGVARAREKNTLHPETNFGITGRQLPILTKYPVLRKKGARGGISGLNLNYQPFKGQYTAL